MIDRVPIKQNDLRNLERLAAQRQLYSDAKKLAVLQFLLNFPLLILASAVALWLNSPSYLKQIDISWLIAIISALVGITSFLINLSVARMKEKAAKIQELFDTDVLALSWNKVLANEPPDPEEILPLSKRYKETKEGDLKSLYGWYSPSISELPDYAAKIVCQRANITWDSALRKRFSNLVVVLAVLCSLALIAAAVYQKVSLNFFILNIVFPILPLALFAYEQKKQNDDALRNMASLRGYIEEAWDTAQSSDGDSNKLSTLTRCVQDGIYTHRKSAPLIFDWFYWRRKDAQEESMNYSSQQLIDQFQQSKVS